MKKRMGRICAICGRGALTSNWRSHSKIATKRKQHINLQKMIHRGKRVKACARCMKAQNKKSAA